MVENPEGGVGSDGREREVGGVITSTTHYHMTSLRVSADELAGYIWNH